MKTQVNKLLIGLSIFSMALISCGNDDDTAKSDTPTGFSVKKMTIKKFRKLKVEPGTTQDTYTIGGRLESAVISSNTFSLLDTLVYTTASGFKNELVFNFTNADYTTLSVITPQPNLLYTKGSTATNGYLSPYDFQLTMDSLYNDDKASTFKYTKVNNGTDPFEMILEGSINY